MRGVLTHNEPMADHTSWRTGGVAEKYYVPADTDDLSVFLSTLDEDENLVWVGLGSNLLVRDGGVKGTVIAVTGKLDDMQSLTDGVSTGAGVTCAKAARFCAAAGFSGAEFLAGIPGTVGGALAMNAGAFGSETWDLVRQVTMLNRKGEFLVRQKEDFEIAYRQVQIPADEWFVAATFRLRRGSKAESQSNIRDLLRRRSQSQPVGAHSCGSVFRNPEGDFAGRLIESCGLKGMKIGGASVSEKHANFIINDGTASAGDIEKLIDYVQQAVMEKFDVMLKKEVRIVGDAD